MDDALRVLERTARASGARADRLAWESALLRSGESPEASEVLVWGHGRRWFLASHASGPGGKLTRSMHAFGHQAQRSEGGRVAMLCGNGHHDRAAGARAIWIPVDLPAGSMVDPDDHEEAAGHPRNRSVGMTAPCGCRVCGECAARVVRGLAQRGQGTLQVASSIYIHHAWGIKHPPLHCLRGHPGAAPGQAFCALCRP